jgi:adenylylsulfate kinase
MLKSPPVIWLLGLSGAGKSTLAHGLVSKFQENKQSVELLDGDVMRAQTGAKGFLKNERLVHLRSMADLAASKSSNGKIIVAAFITPYEEARRYLRKTCHNYIEVWVSTPITECERRDTKGLYAKARRGEIKNFTGVDDPFEIPQSYDIKIETLKTEKESVNELWDLLMKRATI